MCLKTFLKTSIDLPSVKDPDRTFDSLGAAILKPRSPKPLSLLRGTANWLETVQRKVRTLVFSSSISIMSQCNDFSTGVMWSDFFVPSTTW